MARESDSNQYACASPRRRDLVRAAADPGGNPIVNGIDFVEVSPSDQKILLVHFIHNVPGETGGVPTSPNLSAINFVIDGGVRVTDIGPAEPITAAGKIVTIKVDKTGDYSTYTLRLVSSPAVPEPPPGFDPLLAQVDFSFKVNCESDFDCRTGNDCSDTSDNPPYINYLAKDYQSFRRLILDRLSVTMPDWRERSPADIGIALVELLAYTGDYLSYYQDAVATEAYLGTARRRTSVRRHARLVDYALDDGANARAWLAFETDADRGNALTPALALSTAVIAAPADGNPDLRSDVETIVFETMRELVEVRVSRNEMRFYTWGDAKCCLPKGATRATLEGSAATLDLRKGQPLIFEEVLGATSGKPEDADISHRHAVVLSSDGVERVDPLNGTTVLDIEWQDDDALPFPLCLNEFVDANGILSHAAVARGNVVLADHGQTFSSPDDLNPLLVPGVRTYRPFLRRTDLTIARSYSDSPDEVPTARSLTAVDAKGSLPAITLRAEGDTWRPRTDLLASDRFAPDFVVEIEEDNRAYLRFGDGRLGRKPEPGTQFTATYRVGHGTRGNVGAESLNRIVPPIAGLKVRNPLPASGGRDAEAISRARLLAPVSFRTQERAVTEEDYAAIAERHPGVQRAAATRRWTGSWYTMFITVDRRGGAVVDATFEKEMRAFMERFRLAGYDLEIDAPRYVPLEIVATVCVRTGYLRASVKQSLLAAFNDRRLRDGSRGFFHPDNFSFGQPVYLSQVIARAMRVPGVERVNIDNTPPRPDRFQRLGEKPQGEIEKGLIPIDRLEIARLDNDPSAPENGRIDFILQGGS